jgi:hypothetical protein
LAALGECTTGHICFDPRVLEDAGHGDIRRLSGLGTLVVGALLYWIA